MVKAPGQTQDVGPAASSMPSPPTPRPAKRMTERQIEAVYAVMRLLRDDSAQSPLTETILCDRCRRQRPSHGSVSYGEHLLCNGCATDYELLRVARTVRGIEDFLHAPSAL